MRTSQIVFHVVPAFHDDQAVFFGGEIFIAEQGSPSANVSRAQEIARLSVGFARQATVTQCPSSAIPLC